MECVINLDDNLSAMVPRPSSDGRQKRIRRLSNGGKIKAASVVQMCAWRERSLMENREFSTLTIGAAYHTSRKKQWQLRWASASGTY